MRQRVAGELRDRGARVKEDWLQLCLYHVRFEEGLDAERADLPRLVDSVFRHFLATDLKQVVSQGSLPEDVHTMHKQTLQGSHLLQIEEVINIEEPIENLGRFNDEDEEKALEKKQKRDVRDQAPTRYSKQQKPANAHRTMKLSLTDGVQKVFGLEYRRLNALDPERTSPGTKIVVRDVLVRRGMLLLIPQGVQVLGGMVESLIEAQAKATNLKRKRGQDQGNDSTQLAPHDDQPSNPKRSQLVKQETGRTASSTSLPSLQTKPLQTRSASSLKLQSPATAVVPKYSSQSSLTTALTPVSSASSPSLTSANHPSSSTAVYIPFFSRSSASATPHSKSTSDSLLSPPTPPGINDSADSIEDEEDSTKFSSIKADRIKEERDDDNKRVTPAFEEEAASEATIYLLDEETPRPEQLVPIQDDISDDFGFCLGDLPEFSDDAINKDLPFLYIDQIQSDLATGRTVTIKAASIELLKGSFQYKINGKYSLELKLEDGSGTLQALMSDEVVTQLIGLGCSEFNANLTKGPEGINENKRRMRQLEFALFNLEGLMEVALADPKPIITRIYPPTIEHISQLLDRVSAADSLLLREASS